MFRKEQRKIRKRMEIYVKRHSIDRRPERNTRGNRRHAQQTGIVIRLIRSVAVS